MWQKMLQVGSGESGGGRTLPKEYQEVAYIESTGTQWIDTGIIPNENTAVEVEYSLTSNTAAYLIGVFSPYGSAGNRGRYTIFYNNNTVMLRDKRDVDMNYAKTYDNFIHNIKVKPLKVYIDNAEQTSSTYAFTNPNTCDKSFGLFGFYNNGMVYGSNRLYFCKIYDGNNLLAHYIPCYRIADNVIGLFDIINQIFYTNKGTGEFRKGINV